MSPESQEVSYISNLQYENHGLVPLNIVATFERKNILENRLYNAPFSSIFKTKLEPLHLAEEYRNCS